ncbi:MAG: glucoamylase family protein [Nocardioidaceae bacterium]
MNVHRSAVVRATAAAAVLGLGVLTLQSAQAQPAVHGRAGHAAPAPHGGSVARFTGLDRTQRSNLMAIARRTWAFYGDDVDPVTHLPLDNVTYAGGSSTPTSYGRYTSSANIGVYLWAVVSAQDLGLITRQQAADDVNATLRSVRNLARYKGFLYQWYDTSTGAVLTNPGGAACSTTTGTFDNCSFVSNVDNGWYASGLIEVRQAIPQARHLADSLLKPMDFSIFYDGRAETHCNTNPAVTGNQPTGQMYGGYYVGSPPDQGNNYTHYYHNGALYSDPRISAYIGMGRHQMPGNVWWRSWRELPPPAPFADCQQTDPDFSWQGQWPMGGSWTTVTDPQSHQRFPVWEGHYTYPGSHLTFIPTYSGGMFEGLMVNDVVPETSWGTHSFGLADRRLAEVQIKYAKEQLHLPVWGMSPSSTADDSGGYGGFGVEGLRFPYHGVGATASDPNQGLSQCHGCATEDVVTPHASFIALDVVPQRAYANIQRLRTLYPGVYGSRGFFDAVNPSTGAVGHRILVLDQSMIMASLDNALRDRALQRHFAADRVSRVARTYLSYENMSLG